MPSERDELPAGFQIVEPQAAAPAAPEGVEELPPGFTVDQERSSATPTDVLAQGVAFGFADEIAGAAAVTADKALGLFGRGSGRPAGEVFEEARASKEQAISDVPAAVRVPTELLGGVVTGGKAGAAIVRGLSKLPAMVRPVIAGAAEGAVVGAGASQPGERAGGAVIGATAGTVLGIAVPLTIAGITKAVTSSPALRKLGAAGRQAARRTLEALKSDDITMDQAVARLNRLGPEAVVADVGEENVKQLAQAVTGTAGKGRRQAGRVLGKRSRNAARRVVQAVRGVVSGDDAIEVSERLMRERSTAAGPLYDKALAVGQVADDEIDRLITKSQPLRQAIAEAKRLDPDLADLPDNHMVLLDKAYKALGGKANKARVSGDGTLSNALNDIRVRFRDRLVELNPAYGDALDTFAGRSSLIDALDLGRDVFKPKAGVTAKMVDALSDSEREMFKVGLADALVDRVERGVTASAAKRLLRTPKIERQIKTAFGDDLRAFREFKAALLKEIEFAQTAGIRFGSRTAPLESEIGRVARPAVEAADVALDVAGGGSPVRSALDLARRATGRQSGIPADVNEQLGRLLFTQSPDLSALRLVEQNALRRIAAQSGVALPAVGGANVLTQTEGRRLGRQ